MIKIIKHGLFGDLMKFVECPDCGERIEVSL